jgi:hypothetical protein
LDVFGKKEIFTLSMSKTKKSKIFFFKKKNNLPKTDQFDHFWDLNKCFWQFYAICKFSYFRQNASKKFKIFFGHLNWSRVQ